MGRIRAATVAEYIQAAQPLLREGALWIAKRK